MTLDPEPWEHPCDGLRWSTPIELEYATSCHADFNPREGYEQSRAAYGWQEPASAEPDPST